MAVSKSSKKKHQSYISVPSQIINSISQSSLDSLLHSPKKKQSRHRPLLNAPRFIAFLTFALCSLWMLKMWAKFDPVIPFSRNPCFMYSRNSLVSGGPPSMSLQLGGGGIGNEEIEEEGEIEFWKQPQGLGFRPCLEFTGGYRTESEGILKDKSKYLIVVVAGGMNQQRNQIVDAVVIARILGAALVVPILQVNVIWGDERFVLLSLSLS